jgi:hypothetical protein
MVLQLTPADRGNKRSGKGLQSIQHPIGQLRFQFGILKDLSLAQLKSPFHD